MCFKKMRREFCYGMETCELKDVDHFISKDNMILKNEIGKIIYFKFFKLKNLGNMFRSVFGPRTNPNSYFKICNYLRTCSIRSFINKSARTKWTEPNIFVFHRLLIEFLLEFLNNDYYYYFFHIT